MSVGSGLTVLTRVGFAARGLLYIVIALMLIRSGRSEDPSGALDELASSGGDPLVLAMAVGLLAYGLWRLADAALNIEGHDGGAKGLRQRLAVAGSGIIYSVLAWQAFQLLEALGEKSTADGGSAALHLPEDPLLLIAAGVILLGAGAFQLIKAYSCSFCQRLEARVANRPAVRWAGRAGYSARGLIFIVSGYFALRAGLGTGSTGVGGMQQALRWLDSPVDQIVAGGLLLFGLFSIVEAWFRTIHQVPIDGLVAAAAVEPQR